MIGDWNDASTWAPALLLCIAVAATFVWRGLGTAIAARIDPDSGFFQWISCVAYGLLAGLIARIVVMPVGLLGDTHLADRLGATAMGFVLFLLFRRHIAIGTLSTVAIFMALVWARETGLL